MLVCHRCVLLLISTTLIFLLAYSWIDNKTGNFRGNDNVYLPVDYSNLVLNLSAFTTELEIERRRSQPVNLEKIRTLANIMNLPGLAVKKYTFNENENVSSFADQFHINNYTTILLFVLELYCARYAEGVLTGIHNSNLNMKIILGSQDSTCEKIYRKFNIKNMEIVHYNVTTSDGEIWNDLISRVTTEFVVIGRDLDHWSWFSRLHRQISAFDISKNVVVVGGSSRNSTGHWKIGCYQSEMRNYALKYLDDHYASKNGCMFCDHLQNSFISKTKYLLKMKLDPSINRENIFEEFFIRVKISGGIVLNCPDAMYFSTNADDVKRESNRSSWLIVAQKYKLNYVFYPPNTKFKYSREEIGINCEDYFNLTRSHLLPPCCEEMYIKAWEFIQNLSESYNLKFVISTGTLLGAVKVRGVLPWDIDGDLDYLSVQHNLWIGCSSLFKGSNFGFREIQSPKSNNRSKSLTGGYIVLQSANNTIEMFGYDLINTKILPIELQNISTKAELRGIWVYSKPNPGLYARCRYGIEYLKHAHSWRHTGGIHSYVKYKAGRFNVCPEQNFHSCTDKYYPDGNLQFLIS